MALAGVALAFGTALACGQGLGAEQQAPDTVRPGYYRTSDSATLRLAPNDTALAIIKAVDAGHEVQLVRCTPGWCFIEVSPVFGWIPRRVIPTGLAQDSSSLKSAPSARVVLPLMVASPARGQVKTAIIRDVDRLRLAVPDFKAATNAPQIGPLSTVFNETLWNDLDDAGIFETVSKSLYPLTTPGLPNEFKADAWGNLPPNARIVTLGNLGVANGKLTVQGWLFDVRNPGTPQILAKQYLEEASGDNARVIAHRLADEIIARFGGGLRGVAESKIYYVSTRSGYKEIWAMDYDGAKQHQLTHLNSVALSPRVSPDNSRVVFNCFLGGAWQLCMHSLDLGGMVSFPRFGGSSFSPAWSSDGSKLAFSSSMGSRDPDPSIFAIDASGTGPKRLTVFKGPNLRPVWNPKTNAEIAWVSRRNGQTQIYMMDADGSNVQQVTAEGTADPSWALNGLTLAFTWTEPGVLARADIYVMDVSSRQFVQLTHDSGRNVFPSWSPDGRHIVFQSDRTGSEQIWSMLADGTHQHQLTRDGKNTEPNWSYK